MIYIVLKVISFFWFVFNIFKTNIVTFQFTIIADFQRRKSSELETPGKKKVLLAGGNKKVRTISNPYLRRKKGNNNNNNNNNNKSNNNNNNNNNIDNKNNNKNNNRNQNGNNTLPPESEDIRESKIRSIISARGCDRNTAEIIYEKYRIKPCYPFNKTGLCRNNTGCWFAHCCKDCGGPHPSCNCPMR